MKEFARAIISDQPDELTCAACAEELAAYVDAQVLGEPTSAEHAQIEQHLQVCPHCAQAYQELFALVSAAYTEDLPQPAQQPTFDFSFLKPATAQPIRWGWDTLGRLLIEFSDDLLRSLQPPAASSAPAAVKSGSGAHLYEFQVKDEAADIHVTITAEKERQAEEQCVIVVEVNIPSRGGWPNLAGSAVTVKRQAAEVGTQTTDAFGKTVFEGIATADLPALRFEITPIRDN